MAHPTAAPLPLLKLQGINDNKVYLPLSESRDWQTGVCKLTCFESYSRETPDHIVELIAPKNSQQSANYTPISWCNKNNKTFGIELMASCPIDVIIYAEGYKNNIPEDEDMGEISIQKTFYTDQHITWNIYDEAFNAYNTEYPDDEIDYLADFSIRVKTHDAQTVKTSVTIYFYDPE